MENEFLLTDDLLWDYADGFLSTAEKNRVETYLRQQPEAQRRLQVILDEKATLATLSMEAPEPGFANRVMAAWAVETAQASAKARGKDWIIWLISLAMALFVLTPVVVMFFTASELTPDVLPLPEMPVFDWSVWVNSPVLWYAMLLLVAIMGLRFLDKILQHQGLAQKLA